LCLFSVKEPIIKHQITRRSPEYGSKIRDSNTRYAVRDTPARSVRVREYIRETIREIPVEVERSSYNDDIEIRTPDSYEPIINARVNDEYVSTPQLTIPLSAVEPSYGVAAAAPTYESIDVPATDAGYGSADVLAIDAYEPVQIREEPKYAQGVREEKPIRISVDSYQPQRLSTSRYRRDVEGTQIPSKQTGMKLKTPMPPMSEMPVMRMM